jgi:dTMP kinase
LSGKHGIFIVLEGIEGSGKTTQAALLGEWLEQLDLPYRLTREPGGTELGESIRRLLLHGGAMPAVAELLLMLAARSALLAEVVRPALAADEIVVADRYSLSTLAYQGYGRELDLPQVRRAIKLATDGLVPDLTLVLDVPRSEGEARRASGRSGEDRIERAGSAFHGRVAQAYRLLADTEPQTMRLDGGGEPGAVQLRIRRELTLRFPETFPSATG